MAPASIDSVALGNIFALSLEGIFYVLVFAIHAIFISYHWFTYGNSRSVALTALATYLVGGAVLFLTFSFALNAI